MASEVLETPSISDSSEPSAAAAAPARTTGSKPPAPAARTASAKGAAAVANRSGPSTASAVIATVVYTARVMASEIPTARGMVRAGSRTSSPRVAIRG